MLDLIFVWGAIAVLFVLGCRAAYLAVVDTYDKGFYIALAATAFVMDGYFATHVSNILQ